MSLAYETIVEPQQAGLVDAKHSHLMQAPLHPEEAWHHYRAGKNGIVDSARFLASEDYSRDSILQPYCFIEYVLVTCLCLETRQSLLCIPFYSQLFDPIS